MVKSSAPAATSCPSAKCTFITSPLSMDCTPTVARACTLPMARTWTGTSRCAASVTVTGTAGGAPLAVAGSAP